MNKINKTLISEIVNELEQQSIHTIIKNGLPFPTNFINTLEDHYNAIFDGYQINYKKQKVVGYIHKHKITLFRF